MTPVERAAEHPLIRAALEEAGWTPARHQDLDDWVTSLRAEGFTIVAPALDVLRELGGLTITPPRRDDAAFGSGVVVIDPLWAATGEAERIRVRERELGSDLCPVGEWMAQYILLVADDGSLMAETTFQVLRVGRDIADALHRMIVADTPPEEVQVIAADVPPAGCRDR